MKRRDLIIGMGSLGLGASAGFPAGAFVPRPGSVAAAQAWAAATGLLAPKLGRTDALLVLQNGQPVFERYGADGGPAIRHVAWSMTKSITQALVGIAVGQGKVNIDEPLKVAPNTDKRLNLRALITLTDGLNWTDGSYSPTDSDASKMLYGVGRMDGAAYTAAKAQAYAPGTRPNLPSPDSYVEAAVLLALQTPDTFTGQVYNDAQLIEILGSDADKARFRAENPPNWVEAMTAG